MAKPKRSNTVDEAVKKLYARMATEAARQALEHVKWNRMGAAETNAVFVDEWLTKAGAKATSWYFSV